MAAFVAIFVMVLIFAYAEVFFDFVCWMVFWLFCVMWGLDYLGFMKTNESIKYTFLAGIGLFVVLQAIKKLRRTA